jgi:energy-coupling factor transporter ATP-binding protein EcfA2
VTTTTAAIVVEDLSFRYQGRRRPTFERLSFSVAAGETLLVLGPSGCGKSTLALCLNGLIPHGVPGELSGRVVVAGHDVRETPVATLARTAGLVFQDPDAQFCMLRADDEVAFGLENLNVPRAEMDARIERALDQVGLGEARRARIDRLSGGGRQRLALACVLAMEPEILIFDEPTSNLDPAGAEEVFANVARLKAAGRHTIVIVEHRLDHLISLVDRLLVLGPDGSKLALGPPHEVLLEHAAQLDELGIWIPQVSELANRVRRRSVGVEPYPLTLEQAADAFGRLIGCGRVEALGVARDDDEPPGGACAGTTPAPGADETGGTESALTRARSPWEREAAASPPTPLHQIERGAGRARRGEAAPAVEISHLDYRYPSGQVALRDVSLTIPEGSFFALVGPNGAGKSTLAAHLIGSIRSPANTVKLLGRDVRTIAATEIPSFVGYVFQNPEHQFVAGTVYDELAFGLRLCGLPEAEVEERVAAMLADFGLAGYARANPFTLSHGEKRRLSVATMLILGQKILVLDEPTFGQDRKNTIALMAKLADLNRAGRTIVMITHDVRLVAEYAREVVVLIDGSVAYSGDVDGLFADAALLERARLVAPPLLELSRRLANVDRTFPPAATIDRFVDALSERLERGTPGRRQDSVAVTG